MPLPHVSTVRKKLQPLPAAAELLWVSSFLSSWLGLLGDVRTGSLGEEGVMAGAWCSSIPSGDVASSCPCLGNPHPLLGMSHCGTGCVAAGATGCAAR